MLRAKRVVCTPNCDKFWHSGGTLVTNEVNFFLNEIVWVTRWQFGAIAPLASSWLCHWFVLLVIVIKHVATMATCMQSPLTLGWCYHTAQEFYSAVKLLSSLLMYQVDRHPCIGNIKHKYNSDFNWMKMPINILSPYPVMLKKTLISIGDVLFGDVLTDNMGTF